MIRNTNHHHTDSSETKQVTIAGLQYFITMPMFKMVTKGKEQTNKNLDENRKNTAKRNIKPLIFGTADMTSPYY